MDSLRQKRVNGERILKSRKPWGLSFHCVKDLAIPWILSFRTSHTSTTLTMLNNFGKLAIAEIVFYIPVLAMALVVTIKHGFNRRVGWILLFIFSQVRILGAILSIVSQTSKNPSDGLLTAAGIVQSLGLSPLLLTTAAFVTGIFNHLFPHLKKIAHLGIHGLVTGGVVLATIGGIHISPSSNPSDQAEGHKDQHIGVILFLGAYLALFGLHLFLWTQKLVLSVNQLRILRQLSVALPFLGVRVIYSVLGAFTKAPSKFSSLNGDWRINLVMGLLMEYIVVWTYIYGGMTTTPEEKVESQYYLSQTPSNEAYQVQADGRLRNVYKPGRAV